MRRGKQVGKEATCKYTDGKLMIIFNRKLNKIIKISAFFITNWIPFTLTVSWLSVIGPEHGLFRTHSKCYPWR